MDGASILLRGHLYFENAFLCVDVEHGTEQRRPYLTRRQDLIQGQTIIKFNKFEQQLTMALNFNDSLTTV